MTDEIVPLREEHFEGLLVALDAVARAKRILAFQAASSQEEAFAFYRNTIGHGHPHFVVVVDGCVAGWCDVFPAYGESRAHVGILGIALVPAARHLGLGAALMCANDTLLVNQRGLESEGQGTRGFPLSQVGFTMDHFQFACSEDRYASISDDELVYPMTAMFRMG